MISEGKAYRCYCTPEELEAERRQAQAEKRAYKYSRRCLKDPPQDRTVFAVRFKVPGGEVHFTDMVRGDMRFDADLIGDFIIIKSDTYPTYQFATRSTTPDEDHARHPRRGAPSNTPYQLLLIDALAYERPEAYAHMPLILASDGAKLSKRKHPESNLALFREQGYLPEAILNYIVLLGWSLDDKTEIFSLQDLIDVFSLERINKAPASFDWGETELDEWRAPSAPSPRTS